MYYIEVIMGFLGTIFSTITNKWTDTATYLEATDCRGEGHRVRIMKEDGKFRIYPNYQLLNLLKKDPEIIMQFSVNGSILNAMNFNMVIKGDYLESKFASALLFDFERVLYKHGVIQIGLNGISAGMYNSKGYF